MRRVAAVLAATPLLLLAGAPLAHAQTGSVRTLDTGTPDWMLGWSPLRPLAQHAYELPRAPDLPGLLSAPEPGLGLLWTAGNPGAVPFQVPGRWNELRVAGAFDDGAYRRPMDPDGVDVLQFSGFGWERVGSAGAAVGRIAVDREKQERIRWADQLQPHTSDPLVVADSSSSDMRRLRGRFEGAFGWRFGDWGLGLAAGIEARDHRANLTQIPRRGRVSTVGATLGVVRRIPVAGLRVGAHVRWQRYRETVSLFARLRDAVIFQLQGYAEPPRQVVAPPNLTFFRRLEYDAWGWGLSVAGEVADVAWALAAERASRDDDQFSAALSPEPPTDRWEADGWRLSGAARRRLLDGRLLATGRASYSTLDGDATLADLPGIVFRSSEDVFEGTVDLRYTPDGSAWSAGLALGLRGDSRTRRDFVVDVFSDIQTWTPGVGLEIARQLGTSTSVSAGYAIGFHASTASIPNPGSMGPVYRLLIAPELSLYATQARPNRLMLSVRQRFGSGSALLLRADRESAAPHSVEEGLPFAPRGSRTLWRLSLSLLLTD